VTPSSTNPLRAARKAKGFTLAELSRATNIPMAHLRALEEGREHDIPPGPYVAGYLRTIREALGLPLEGPRELTHPVKRAGMSLPMVRFLAWTSVVAMVVAAWFNVSRNWEPGHLVSVLTVEDDLHQRVEIWPTGPGTLTIMLEGAEAHHIVIPPDEVADYQSEPIVVEGMADITVEANPVGAFDFRRDGESITIVDRETDTRRLVFLVEELP
jgi:transcriptional regulator with XRE-family HTH domain